jgi:hypothetical protein
MCSAQIIDIAQCYPPQPKQGEYPGRDFVEALEESASAAPTTSRASTKRTHVANVDRVEDLEYLDVHFLLQMAMMARQFSPNLWIVVPLLEWRKGLFQILALMLRKRLLLNFFLDGFVMF